MILEFTSDEIIIIGAMAENRTIGSGEGMPWEVPEEYQHFVESVRQQSVIMGRRSYDIFGADFEADTFVITRSGQRDHVTVCSSIDVAVERAQILQKTIFIAGGRSIYALGIPLATRMLLSTIKGQFDGDTLFPDWDPDEWSLHASEDRGAWVLNDWRRL